MKLLLISKTQITEGQRRPGSRSSQKRVVCLRSTYYENGNELEWVDTTVNGRYFISPDFP